MEWLYLGHRGGDGGAVVDVSEILGGLHEAAADGDNRRGACGEPMFFLAKAAKVLPIGTAYGIWTGIGALGAVIVGIVIFKEPATAGRIFFASLLLIGIVGLKLTSA